MFEVAALLYLLVETPLHAGTGSSLGTVDLPIQRERTTRYPMIQGSGIKGPLRALARQRLQEQDWQLIFGPEPTDASDFAGAISVGDARILLFPVRSLTDVFVYATSPEVLARLYRDMARGGSSDEWPDLESVGSSTALLTPAGRPIHGDMLILEEFPFTTRESQKLSAIATSLASRIFPRPSDAYWRDKLGRSLVVLPEDDFRDFTQYSTEVITRVRLDPEKKTVAKGALWTEEHLPAETVLYAPLHAAGARKVGATLSARQVLERVQSLVAAGDSYLQLGGDETIGRGLAHPTWQWLTPHSPR